MSLNIGGYTYINSYHEGKKGYVNKFEKSLKMPFLSVLQNHMPGVRPVQDDEIKIDDSELNVSDKIELSSAVVSATDASGSETN